MKFSELLELDKVLDELVQALKNNNNHILNIKYRAVFKFLDEKLFEGYTLTDVQLPSLDLVVPNEKFRQTGFRLFFTNKDLPYNGEIEDLRLQLAVLPSLHSLPDEQCDDGIWRPVDIETCEIKAILSEITKIMEMLKQNLLQNQNKYNYLVSYINLFLNKYEYIHNKVSYQ